MSFGGGGSGFTFGGSTPSQQQQQPPAFGTTQPSTGGFNFSSPPAPGTQGIGLTLGSQPGQQPQQPASTGFAFGAAATSGSAGGLSFGGAGGAVGSMATPAAPSGFSFGAATTGGIAPSIGASTGGTAFGASGSGFFRASTPSSTTLGASGAAGLMFGANPSTQTPLPASTMGFAKFGASSTTSAPSGFTFSTPSFSSGGGLGLGQKSLSTSYAFGGSGVGASTSTTTAPPNNPPAFVLGSTSMGAQQTNPPSAFGFATATSSTGGLPAFGATPPAAATAPSTNPPPAFVALGTSLSSAPAASLASSINPPTFGTSTMNPPSAFGVGSASSTTAASLGGVTITPVASFGVPAAGAAAASSSAPSFFGAQMTTSTIAPLTATRGIGSVPGGMFGSTPSTVATASGSVLGQSLSTPAAPLSFSAASTGTLLPPTSTPAPASLGSLSAFGASTTTSGLQLGGTSTAAPSAGLPFGSATQAAAKPIGLSISSTSTPASSTGFAFGTGTVQSTSSIAPIATTTATTATTLPTAASTMGFTLGSVAKPTVSGITLGTSVASATVAATTTASSTTPGAATLTTSVVTTAQAVLPSATTATISINFRKLEEDINKWTVELEEQEKIFLNKATEVNAWDRMLITNGEKITKLNEALEKVKLDQEHLDQEIDFIRSQQRELEELLEPLEKSVENLPNMSVHQHADLEREQTFQMAENIDGQLRNMARDLKEVIDFINTTSSGTEDNDDPIQQIGKILNTHIDSLQWIDQNTTHLQKQIDEVSRLYEVRRQEHEKGLQLPPYL